MELAERWNAPVVFGGIGETVTEERTAIPMNSAFLTGRDGRLTDFRYDKQRLVPWVEGVPFSPGAWMEGGVQVDAYG